MDVISDCGRRTRRDATDGGEACPVHVSCTYYHPSCPCPDRMTTMPRYHFPTAPPAQGTGPSAAPVGISADEITEGPERPRKELPDPERPCEDPPGTTDPPAESPAISRKRGGLIYDREHGRWPLEWEDLADFEAWRREEELLHSIDIISSTTAHGGKTSLWTKRRVFVCGRDWSGGKSKYVKKDPKRKQKIPSKKIGCSFSLVIKHYPHTPVILGHIEQEHVHETGLPNVIYTRMSHGARERIKFMLGQKINPREIVSTLNFILGE